MNAVEYRDYGDNDILMLYIYLRWK